MVMRPEGKVVGSHAGLEAKLFFLKFFGQNNHSNAVWITFHTFIEPFGTTT